MKKLQLVLTLLTMRGAAVALGASASFSGNFSETFDEMGTAGTAAPTGWSVFSEAGSHDTFSPSANPSGTGVSPNLTAGALTAHATLTAGAAGTQSGTGGYNFGTTASSTDRALGTSPSGIAATILELNLQNNTGNSIASVSIGYDIDRFTTTAANNSAYAASPTVGLEENPGYWLFYSLDSGSTWNNVSSLNPTLSGPGGIVVPNSVGFTNVPSTTLTLSGSWNAGSTLEFAWVDDNAQSPSPDQLLGLNNVSVLATPEPTSLALASLGVGGVLAWRRRRPISPQSTKP